MAPGENEPIVCAEERNTAHAGYGEGESSRGGECCCVDPGVETEVGADGRGEVAGEGVLVGKVGAVEDSLTVSRQIEALWMGEVADGLVVVAEGPPQQVVGPGGRCGSVVFAGAEE